MDDSISPFDRPLTHKSFFNIVYFSLIPLSFIFQWISIYLQKDNDILNEAIKHGRLDLGNKNQKNNFDIVMSSVQKCVRQIFLVA